MNLIATLALTFTSFAPSDIAAKDIDGHDVRLPVAGKTTCLLFVATECPIANRLAPEMRRIVATHKTVKFFFVYPDPRTTKAMVKQHAKDFELSAPAILDPKFAIAKFAKATVTPEAAVFDPKGRLAYHGRINDLFTEHNVPLDKPEQNDLRDAIDAVLNGKPVAAEYVAPIGCAIPF